MIISPSRQFIFVHIPKTGGTAMALALEDRARADDILIGDTPKAKRRKHRLQGVQTAGRLWKHSTLADIDGLVDRARLDEFLIFTLIRNPWDRVVSYYHWLKSQSFDHPAVGLARTLGFSEFLRHPVIAGSLRAAPFGSYLRDVAGRERTAVFLRLEHLDQDLDQIEPRLGFRPLMARANVSDRETEWRPYYSEQDAALLAEVCALDIARFGYRFDPE